MCKLQELTNGEHFCSVRIHNSEPGDLDMFDDMDNYDITLCHSAAQWCDVLIKNYQVDANSEEPHHSSIKNDSPNIIMS